MNHSTAEIASLPLNAAAREDRLPLRISLKMRLLICAHLWLATTLLFAVAPDSPFGEVHSIVGAFLCVIAAPFVMAQSLASLAGWDSSSTQALSIGTFLYLVAHAGFTLTRKRPLSFALLCAVHVIQAAAAAASFHAAGFDQGGGC